MSAFIELKDVTFAYVLDESHSVPVLRHFNLSVEKGDFVAVLGHNGCGKSTVAKLCNAIEVPQSADTKATTIAHNSLASMAPDQMLAFFNDPANFSNGEAFADWTNPRTGVKQIKVQHPEFETFLGAGSQHANDFTCADCHMPDAVAEDGTEYRSHNLVSPLDNPELIEKTCSQCHTDLKSEVRAVQQKVEDRTYSIGYELEYLTELLADAVESGEYTDADLARVRALARNAQFYWDFVFVENAEGAHNPTLTYECLDKAEELCNQALNLLKALTA